MKRGVLLVKESVRFVKGGVARFPMGAARLLRSVWLVKRGVVW